MIKKLHIYEDYEDDMAVYKQSMNDYNRAYSAWKSNNPKQIFKQLEKSIRNTAYTILRNNGIDDVFITNTPPHFIKRSKSLPYTFGEIRVCNMEENDYDLNYVQNALEEVQDALVLMEEETPIMLNLKTTIEEPYFFSQYNSTHVSLTYSFELNIPDNMIDKPVKPTKPNNPNTSVKVGDVNGVYTTNKNSFYCDDAEDVEELFKSFGYSDLTSLLNALRRAGWLKGSKIYIPKETQFSLSGSDNYYDYITIENGPFNGCTLPFNRYGDNTSVDYLINRYTY
jgi:hypothetical protein